MGKERLLAFSDGVIAIIITIMVLELHPPEEPTLEALAHTAPTFLSYVLSFLNVAIYWNNHHHMMHTADRVNGGILWANMALLFWLSLVPFTTAWMDETGGAAIPTALYAASFLMPAIAFFVLQRAIIAEHGKDHALARAVGRDWKGKASPLAYALAIPAAFISPWITWALVAGVAVIWFVPDKRIERVVTKESAEAEHKEAAKVAATVEAKVTERVDETVAEKVADKVAERIANKPAG